MSPGGRARILTDMPRPVDVDLLRACEIAVVHLEGGTPAYRPIHRPETTTRGVGDAVVLVALLFAVASVPLALWQVRAGATTCAAVSYSVASDAPAGWAPEVAAAFAEVGRLSGVQFRDAKPHDAPAVVVASVASSQLGRHDGVRRVGEADYLRSARSDRPVVAGSIRLDRELAVEPKTAADPRLGHVLLHEIGHVIGLDHSPDPTSMMSAVLSASAVWTASDLAQLRDTGERAGCAASAAHSEATAE